MIEYELGQAVRLTAAFVSAAGAAVDPTTITFKFGALLASSPPPAATPTSAVFGVDVNVVKDSVGNYHYDFVPPAAGIYITQVIGTGVAAAVSVGRIRVKADPFS